MCELPSDAARLEGNLLALGVFLGIICLVLKKPISFQKNYIQGLGIKREIFSSERIYVKETIYGFSCLLFLFNITEMASE